MSHDHDHDHPAIDPRIVAAAEAGCEDSRATISRRALMGITASFFSWAFVPRFAEAGTTNDPRLLIVVLRGGMDGLNTVIPVGDPNYLGLRGGIAIPQASTIALNSMFGLNAAMPKFAAMYTAGTAAVVHAACVPLRIRSHFDCQDNLENGMPGKVGVSKTGWVNRLLTALPAGNSVKARGALQVGSAPLIMLGPAPVLGWSPAIFTRPDQAFDNNLLQLYGKRDPALQDQLTRGLAANALATGSSANVGGSLSTLQKSFRGAGRLLASPTGPRVAVLSVGGWDTHVNQGSALAAVLGSLDTALDDFRVEMGAEWDKTAVVCATEFGRTAAVNGTYGTDHGTGTVALLAGGAINGGQVFGTWPGLGPSELFESRDLRATTDLRAVFKGLLADHLGVARRTLDETVFPQSAAVAPMQNLIKAAAPAPAPLVAPNPLALRAASPLARFREQVPAPL
jgi:uncharacterized protein (DUF1501 family)